MTAVVTMKQLLESGVHFGHQTRRWNPKMKRFIHGDRGGIYLIDLNQTMSGIEKSYSYVRDLVSEGGTVLFIGTKKQAQDPIQGYAEKCGMPFINQRWLGGMLTNFETISKRVSKMKNLQGMRDSGEFEIMPKKEALLLNRELTKLERNLNGIRNLERLPDAVFILDTNKEAIAVTESNKLGISVVAVVDTNCDPDVIDYAIPGNDDAIRSADLMCRVISDAVIEGKIMRSKLHPEASAPKERSAEEEAQHRVQQNKARAEAAAAAAQREARVVAAKDVEPEPADAPEAEAPEIEAPEIEAPAPEAPAPAAEASTETDPTEESA